MSLLSQVIYLKSQLNSMKINFIGNNYAGSYIYRVLNPCNYSKHDCVGDLDPLTEKRVIRNDIKDADIVMFHKRKDQSSLEMMKILQKKGKLVGYDIDDTFYMQDSHLGRRGNYKGVYEKIAQQADFITTSTDFLKKEFEAYNDKVYQVKNLIDFSKYPEPKKKNNKKHRILISGSVLWCNDAIKFQDTLKQLDEREDIQLVIFGNYKELSPLKNAEYHKFINPIYYPDKLNDLAIDLCIVPREDNYFNECKSNCKYLEMSALKIPTVAQGFTSKDSPYDRVKAEGAPIVIANGDWLEKIDYALENKDELAENSYQFVKENYDAKQNIFDKVIDKVKDFKPKSLEPEKQEPHQVKGKVKPYTAIVGDYDYQRQDITCFNERTGFDKDVMNAKPYKILSHKYTEEPYSIWLDGNIYLLTEPERLASEWLYNDADMAVMLHPYHGSIGEEVEMIKESGKVEKQFYSLLDRQLEKYKDLPSNHKLAECNVIVRRNNEKVKKFNKIWWEEIKKYTNRDQVSFPYIAWLMRNEIKINYIVGNVRTHPYFKYKTHKAKYG